MAATTTPLRFVPELFPELRQRALAPEFRRQRRVLRHVLRVVMIALLVRVFVGEASLVPTSSMEGTILVGDHLFVNKFLYGPRIPLLGWRLPRLKTIRRGDIVVFHYPRNPELIFVKRVVAVGGDTVELRHGALLVNGGAVAEPYAVHRDHWQRSPWESMAARKVAANELFVLGDNRDNSSDSRDWGSVPAENVIGSPLVVFWSYDAPSTQWLDERPLGRLRLYASICEHFFSHTRWSRTGTLL